MTSTRLLVVLAVACVAPALSACSGGESTDASSTGGTTDATTTSTGSGTGGGGGTGGESAGSGGGGTGGASGGTGGNMQGEGGAGGSGCAMDTDGDGVCDPDEVPGCTDAKACNYDASATDDDGSCTLPDEGYDCMGACLDDADMDGVCDPFEVPGCTYLMACNYDPAATDDDGSCTFASPGYDCQGVCLSDVDMDGVCDPFEVLGCTDASACNYEPAATNDDASCTFASPGYDCQGACLSDVDSDGVCDPFEVPGCTSANACNYDANATDDDGSCTYPAAGYDCQGVCLQEAVQSYKPIAAEYMVATPQDRVAQTFTASATYALTSVVLPLYSCKSNGLVDAQVRILATTNGKPNATVLGTSALVGNASINGSCNSKPFGDVTFSFATAVPLTNGTSYAIELVATGAPGGGLYWRRSSTPTDPQNPYAGGAIWEWPDFDLGWTSNTNLDLAFFVKGCEGASP